MGDTYQPIELTEEVRRRGAWIQPRPVPVPVQLTAENRLRFWDPAAQEYLLTHFEAINRAAEAENRAAEAEDERNRERSARIEAEAEIAKLRDRLRRS